MVPSSINFLITSLAFTPIRFASSETIMTSATRMILLIGLGVVITVFFGSANSTFFFGTLTGLITCSRGPRGYLFSTSSSASSTTLLFNNLFFGGRSSGIFLATLAFFLTLSSSSSSTSSGFTSSWTGGTASPAGAAGTSSWISSATSTGGSPSISSVGGGITGFSSSKTSATSPCTASWASSRTSSGIFSGSSRALALLLITVGLIRFSMNSAPSSSLMTLSVAPQGVPCSSISSSFTFTPIFLSLARSFSFSNSS